MWRKWPLVLTRVAGFNMVCAHNAVAYMYHWSVRPLNGMVTRVARDDQCSRVYVPVQIGPDKMRRCRRECPAYHTIPQQP